MNRLILSTANSDLVVVVEKGDEIFSKVETSVKRHNETIISLIVGLLKVSGLMLEDIDEFGVVVGPGSFTGIRVGTATVKAFRDVLQKPAKGINNLALLAEFGRNVANVYAIDGSSNTFFVAENIDGKLYIHNKNLTRDELASIVKDNKIACFKLSEQMKRSGLNFVEVEFDPIALLKVYEDSQDTTLTPVYYQLSQAENDKINNSTLKIMPAELRDIDEIMQIENTNFELGLTGDRPQTRLEIENTIANNMPNYVARIDDELVGYVFCEKTDELNVSRVAVLKKYQNHGFATKLINFVEDIARSSKMNMSLEVSKNNYPAIRLYTKLGFQLRRERKNYYQDGSDCLEMVKEIVQL